MHDYILNTCCVTISRKYYMPELVGEFYFSVRKKHSMDERDIRGDTEKTPHQMIITTRTVHRSLVEQH